MEKYIEYFFDLIVNAANIDDIKNVLPSINLDKTNYVLDILIGKLKEEIEVAVELEDEEYLSYLREVIVLLSECRIEEKPEISLFESENVIIFSDTFLKSLKRLNDSLFYGECLSTIESLKSKQWMESNKSHPEKYKRLHGEAYGLSEVKTKNVRLLHMPINCDFWYVSDIIKKEGDTSKQYRLQLISLTSYAKAEIEAIRQRFSKDGVLNYDALIEFAKINNEPVMDELERFGGKKR